MTKKVAIITCYRKREYARKNIFNTLVESLPDYVPIVVNNRFPGLMRYPEVIWRVFIMRLQYRPDIYILTFRGYEMLLPVRLLSLGKPLVFDEFINAEEWLLENAKVRQGSLMHKLFHFFYRLCLKLPRVILADTKSHANYSAHLSGVSMQKYAVVAVGVDEDIFKPAAQHENKKVFEVFYYSSESQPLHGIEYVCKAAELLTDKRDIHFTLIGPGNMQQLAQRSMSSGANITYIERVPYAKIADYTRQANLCLGGPFGGTLQSQFVITGKTYQFIASARPTVIGKNKETTTFFVSKRNCLLVEQANTGALKQTIEWAYKNPKALAEIGKQARHTYETHFSSRQIAQQLQVVLERC